MKKLLLMLFLVLFVGCKEEMMPQNYDELKISKIRIGEIEYVCFTDFILEDKDNDFIGFVTLDRQGNPCWVEQKEVSYLIETTNVPELKDDKAERKWLEQYYLCKDTFKPHEYLYKHK